MAMIVPLDAAFEAAFSGGFLAFFRNRATAFNFFHALLQRNAVQLNSNHITKCEYTFANERDLRIAIG